MLLIKILQMTKKFLVISVASLAVMSCDRSDDVRQERLTQKRGNCGDEGDVSRKYEEIFRSHIMATNITVSASYEKTGKICKELAGIKDRQKSFRLLDQFFEMAIAQEVTATEYNRRQCWFDMLWFMSFGAFITVQEKLGNDYEYWDKMFRFFAKYTNEIGAVERTLPKNHSSLWKESTWNKGRYLHGIRCDLKTWVRVIRDFYYPKLTEDFTQEQKADIMRRFKEVEKYTVTPPHYPGGRELKK